MLNLLVEKIAAAVARRILPSIRQMEHNIMASASQVDKVISDLRDAVSAQTTVVASVKTFIEQGTKPIQEAIDDEDLDAAQEALNALKSNTASLAASIAQNTAAASEGPAQAQAGTDTGSAA